MNPLQGVQQAIQNGWNSVLEALLRLNPVPEPLRPLLGSRWFWFALWLATFSALGRNLFGERFGAWLGLAAGGALWAAVVPNPEAEVYALLALGVLVPLAARLWRGSSMGQRTRGLKTCPECAEEVKRAAKVCKHCAHRFEPRTDGS
jgi:hypothetical protein